MIRTAVLGGTFNPIHNGHIILIQELLSQSIVDEVWLMPTGYPPYKPEERTSAIHRYEMCRLAIEGLEKVDVSDHELHSTGPSYTYETLEKIRALHSDREFLWVIGYDHLETIEKWHQAPKLLSNYRILIFNRGGYHPEKAEKLLRELNTNYPDSFISIHMPNIELSSTEIRRRVKEGFSILGYTTEGVMDYIRLHHLYREVTHGNPYP